MPTYLPYFLLIFRDTFVFQMLYLMQFDWNVVLLFNIEQIHWKIGKSKKEMIAR